MVTKTVPTVPTKMTAVSWWWLWQWWWWWWWWYSRIRWNRTCWGISFFFEFSVFFDLPVHDGQVGPCSWTFWGYTSGGVNVYCIYTLVRWVTAGDSGLCCRACMTSLEPPCVLMLQKVLRVKSFLFACCFCFFALQSDDSWYWLYFFVCFSVSVASDAIFGAAKLKYLMAS